MLIRRHFFICASVVVLGFSVPAASAQDTIKFGYIADLSGPYQAIGTPAYNGGRLAVQQINDAGGVTVKGKKYKVELVEAPGRSEERQTSQSAVDLIQDKGIKFLFGGLGKLGPVVMQLSEPNKVIYFTSSSAAAGHLDKTKYMVLTVPPIDVRAALTAKGLKQLYPDAKRVAILLPQDSITTEMTEPLKKSFADQGMEVVASEIFPPGSTDVAAPLTRIRSAKPDTIFTGWVIDHAAPIIRTNKEINAAPRYFSQGLSCDQVRAAGIDRPFAANTLVGANLSSPLNDKAAKLARDYKAFVKEDNPQNMYAVMWNYDFFFLLAKAIEAAGTFEDTDAVLAAMRKISYDGVAGRIQIDQKNRSIYGFDFCKLDKPQGEIQAVHINP